MQKKKRQQSVKYLPTDEAKTTPRNAIVDGERCGIGGQILTDSGTVIKEATPEQYKKAYKNGGRKHLIYAEIKQSDS